MTLFVAMAAAIGIATAAPPRLGVDVLLADSLHLVRGRAVGLVTNYAAVDAQGVSVVERLRAGGVRLVALFSPEHGFRGAADPGEAVASSIDSATGLPIHSLYGRTSRPTDEMLAGVEVLLVDLPDVGARYYTYLHTTMEVMHAAGPKGVRVIVLDRPNPIGGTVGGNILDLAYRSGVGSLAMPIRHGMTLGEQARLARRDDRIDVDLVVVPAAGWRRKADGIVTGLPFLPPSPNLKDLESLFHYPGTCLFEGTALSVGRGTDRPFHQIGAPWLDTTAVLAIARRAGLPGVEFMGVTFPPVKPGDGKHAGVPVVGIRLRMTDRRRYDPIRTTLVLLGAVRSVHPDRIGFVPRQFDRLAGGPGIREAIEAGVEPRRILDGWKPALKQWQRRTKDLLLYR